MAGPQDDRALADAIRTRGPGGLADLASQAALVEAALFLATAAAADYGDGEADASSAALADLQSALDACPAHVCGPQAQAVRRAASDLLERGSGRQTGPDEAEIWPAYLRRLAAALRPFGLAERLAALGAAGPGPRLHFTVSARAGDGTAVAEEAFEAASDAEAERAAARWARRAASERAGIARFDLRRAGGAVGPDGRVAGAFPARSVAPAAGE
jgi:hypothetical protein